MRKVERSHRIDNERFYKDNLKIALGKKIQELLMNIWKSLNYHAFTIFLLISHHIFPFIARENKKSLQMQTLSTGCSVETL
jgi:hypothetical protein